MGASAIASGRKPSMDRIKTLRARGVGVGVRVGSGVKVCVGGLVAVKVGIAVEIESGVWHAIKKIKRIKTMRFINT